MNEDPAYRLTPAAVIELKDEREHYLVAPDIVPEIPAEYDLATIYVAMNRQGVLSVWPVKLPNQEGRRDSWRESAHIAATLAMRQWTRIRANMSLGAYETSVPIANWGEPEWPELTLREILEIAFRGMLVDSPEHPVIKRLLGEI